MILKGPSKSRSRSHWPKKPAEARRSVALPAVLTLTAALLTVGFSPVTEAESAAAVSVTDVRGIGSPAGGTSLLTYEAATDFYTDMSLGEPLPGQIVDRQEHASALDGTWGDLGELASWLSPQGKMQFFPRTELVESAFFSNSFMWLYPDETVPVAAGDRVEMAMGNVSWDAPLTWDRPRGEPTGELAWDYAADVRRLGAVYGGEGAEMDVVMFRADIVARGGDVDARSDPVAAPPLVIDLPETSTPAQALEASAMVVVSNPESEYVADFSISVNPVAGEAVVTASVQGYLPEARQTTLPNEAVMKEWHLPLTGIITMKPVNDEASAQALISPRMGGTVVAAQGELARRMQVDPGATAVISDGVPTLIGPSPSTEPPAAKRESRSNAPPEAQKERADAPANSVSMDGESTAQPWLMQELTDASHVSTAMSEATTITQGHNTWDVTIDPDYRGKGILALGPVQHRVTGVPYAEVTAVPFAEIGGERLVLDRSRQVALRAFPMRWWKGALGVQWGGSGPVTRTSKTEVLAFVPALSVETVYDLGEGRYAFVEWLARAHPANPASFGGGSVSTLNVKDRLLVSADIRSLEGESLDGAVVQMLELPGGGPVTFGETSYEHEFQAPLDDASGQQLPLRVGNHQVTAATGGESTVTVVRAPGPLTEMPAPDSVGSILNGPLALYYTPSSDRDPSFSTVWTEILGETRSPDASTPKPIGEPCGTPQVQDVPVVPVPDAPDALPFADIQSAWFDADESNIYASIQLRDVPVAAAQGMTLRYDLRWRYEHVGKFAKANLDDKGEWTFEFGTRRLVDLGQPAEVTGDVQPGPHGTIRIAIPRDLLRVEDGEIFRDAAAFSWTGQEADGVAGYLGLDQAPEGSSLDQGLGGEYRVNHC